MRIILYFIFFSWGTLAAQSVKLEDLEKLLGKKELPSKETVDLLNLGAREFIYTNPLKAVEFSYRALELSKKIYYTTGEANALRGLASSSLLEERYYLSLKHLQEAIHLFEKTSDSTGIAGCYVSLGHVYRRLKNLEKELFYNQFAYDFFVRKGDIDRIAVTTHNLGETYLNIGEIDKALDFTNQAIHLNDSLGKLAVLSSCYKTLGNIRLAKQEYDKAEQNFNSVLKISKFLGDKSQKIATVDALLHLSRLSLDKQNSSKAIEYLEEAASITSEYKLFDFVNPVYEELIDLYGKENNINKVLITFKKYQSTLETLNQIKGEVMNRFAESLSRTDTLETTNIELKEKSILQENLLNEKNIRNRLALILVIALLVLAIILWLGLIKIRKANNYLTAQQTIIRTQKKELEELNVLKDKFLSILSHDIKAPLQGLKNYADLLTEENLKVERSKLVQFGKELKDQLEHTSSMADNLIAWVKLQMKSFVTKPVLLDLSALLKEVTGIYQPIAVEKKLTIQVNVETPCYCKADLNQVDFIVRNIVHNAIKYSYPGGVVRISVETSNNNQILSVTDEGIGMTEETVRYVMGETYFQSSITGTSGEGGTGLGLRICREFAVLNHGNIEVSSQEGKGSTFKLILPKS
jgi:signal transduction histidine kinase